VGAPCGRAVVAAVCAGRMSSSTKRLRGSYRVSCSLGMTSAVGWLGSTVATVGGWSA
jgi:hypothetical protein